MNDSEDKRRETEAAHPIVDENLDQGAGDSATAVHSSEKLAAALEEHLYLDLAARARRHEFHYFRSPYALPTHVLVEELKKKGNRSKPLIRRVIDGEFDARKAESDESMASDAMRELGLGPPTPGDDHWRSDEEAEALIAAIAGDALRPWQPIQKAVIPPEEIEAAGATYAAQGMTYSPPNEVWKNDEYQCFVTYLEPRGKGGLLSLSIKRNDAAPAHDWRELQAIKNEIAGWEREAVEIYPAESRLVDQADQTWLWVLPAGQKAEVGFRERAVMDDAQRKAELGGLRGKGSQRNWRPGISTGPDYNPGG